MSQAWIVVADSARARIFEADSHSGSCSEVADLTHPASRAHERDLASDRPGRAFDRSGGRLGYGSDFHGAVRAMTGG